MYCLMRIICVYWFIVIPISCQVRDDHRCGSDFDNAPCDPGDCCSKWGWCGNCEEQAKLNRIRDDHRCGAEFDYAPCYPDDCCSKWGWCGKCTAPTLPKPTTNGGKTPSRKALLCAFLGKGRASRATLIAHADALDKAKTRMGFSFKSAQEFAGMLAQVAQETYHMSLMDENCGIVPGGCSKYSTCNWYKGSQYLGPYRSGMLYYGRGPLQMSYPCNYRRFGDVVGIKAYENPDIIANDYEVAWMSALFIWTDKDKYSSWPWNRSCAEFLQKGQLNHCIRKINGFEECDGNKQRGREDALEKRISYYQDIRTRCFGLGREGDNGKLYC